MTVYPTIPFAFAIIIPLLTTLNCRLSPGHTLGFLGIIYGADLTIALYAHSDSGHTESTERYYTYAVLGLVAAFIVRSGARIEVERFLTLNALEVEKRKKDKATKRLRKELRARQEAEAARFETEKKLAESNRLAGISRLAIGMAHQVNNPLTILNGSVYLLKSKLAKANSPDEQLCDKAIGAVARISSVISNTIEFAELSYGEQNTLASTSDEANQTSVNALKAVLAAVTMSGKSTLTVECDHSITGLETVTGGVNRLGKALTEIIRNGATATADDPNGWVRVTINCERQQNLVIRVTDSGPGIPEDLREKIFEPFFSTKSVGDGQGIGLTVARGIIASYGGTLTLEGTSKMAFAIRLPLIVAARRTA